MFYKETITKGEKRLLKAVKKNQHIMFDDLNEDDQYNANRLYEQGLLVLNSTFPLQLTDDGKHFGEISGQRYRDFLNRSIITPIIVAAITSIITNYLLPLLFH